MVRRTGTAMNRQESQNRFLSGLSFQFRLSGFAKGRKETGSVIHDELGNAMSVIAPRRASTEHPAPGPLAAAWEWLARPVHYRAVRNLRHALEDGDAGRLESLLEPTVAVVVDDGRAEGRSMKVIGGRYDAITLLLLGMRAQPGRRLLERSVNGQAGLFLTRDDGTAATISIDFSGRLVSVMWIRLHPLMLRHWNTV